MKKTLTAAAVCAMLSPVAAMADASLYSRIALGIDVAGAEESLENSGSRFGIKASRDIGGGNSIIGRYEFGVDGSQAIVGGGNGNRLSYIGFKGGWGEIQVGSIWSAYFNKVGAVGCDPFTLACFSSMSFRLVDSIGYSGSFGGFGVEATAQFGDEDGDDLGDGITRTQVAASYDIAGFGLSAGIDSDDAGGTDRTGIGIKYGIAGVGLKALITTTDSDASNDDLEELAITLSYGAGPHSVTAEIWTAGLPVQRYPEGSNGSGFPDTRFC